MSLSDYKEFRIGKLHIPLKSVEYSKKPKARSKYIFQLDINDYSIKVEYYIDSCMVDISLLKDSRLICPVIHIYNFSVTCYPSPEYIEINFDYHEKIIEEFSTHMQDGINGFNFFKALLDC